MDSHPSLHLLKKQYPNASSVISEISQLEAKLALPKRRIHVISDVHGDDRKLRHVINNASGGINDLVTKVFGTDLSDEDQKGLLALLYYPIEKMRRHKNQSQDREWRLQTVKRFLRLQFRLVAYLAKTSTKEELLRLIPDEFESLYFALLDESSMDRDPQYVDAMIESLADYDQDITALHSASRLVRNLVVSEVVVAGDLFDRGERGDRVIHYLKNQPKVSFTWGNHDITWMGATLGSEVLIATVLRVSLRYLRLWQLEEGYGILLSPLAKLANSCYADDPAECFIPKRKSDFSDESLTARMHKAIAILEFKLSGTLIEKHPEWEMDDRRILHRINYDKATVEIDGVVHALKDSHFPTINPQDPYALNEEEKVCLSRLRESFISSQRLWEHMLFVVRQGGMSLRRDEALIFHACVPTCEDGTFREVVLKNENYHSSELFKQLEDLVKRTYREGAQMVSDDLDYYYWMWANKDSPLFGKEKMTTFERYFVAEKSTHHEKKDPYFHLLHDPDFCRRVGHAFGMNDDVLIVNGHVPVKVGIGEDPVKKGGNAVTIDGAFSEAYGDYRHGAIRHPSRRTLTL